MELGACHECASRSNLAFHVDFVHKFIAYGFFAEDNECPPTLGSHFVNNSLYYVLTQSPFVLAS
jgi:hypothetical protein